MLLTHLALPEVFIASGQFNAACCCSGGDEEIVIFGAFQGADKSRATVDSKKNNLATFFSVTVTRAIKMTFRCYRLSRLPPKKPFQRCQFLTRTSLKIGMQMARAVPHARSGIIKHFPIVA